MPALMYLNRTDRFCKNIFAVEKTHQPKRKKFKLQNLTYLYEYLQRLLVKGTAF